MKRTIPQRAALRPLILAAGALLLLAGAPAGADEHMNPCAAKRMNPCAAKKMNPCAAKHMNPCAAKHMNPCAAKHMNPCAAKHMNPCAAKHLNPCAMKGKMNPCAAKHMNPCAGKKMNPCGARNANPCGGGSMHDPARFKQPADLALANLDDPKLIAEGEKLWNDRELGTTHMACSSCHLNKYTLMNESFAKPYPHYVAMPHDQAGVSEVTAAEMVNFCMVTPLQAEPLPWKSRKLAALTAYVVSIQPGYTPAPATPHAANPCSGKTSMNPCTARHMNPCNPCAAKRH